MDPHRTLPQQPRHELHGAQQLSRHASRSGSDDRSPVLDTGAVTISIDLELAWGNWDNLGAAHIRHLDAERSIVKRLLQLFDSYEVPVTWAFVAALLEPSEARGRVGGERLWYGPDLIEAIVSARVRHDLGSHGGRHKYFDALTEAEAEDDLAFARSVHAAQGLPLQSFVFPRNQVAKTHVLSRHGVRVYRGVDHAWHQRIRQHSIALGRAANLLDKLVPFPPESVVPETDGALVRLPGSMLLLGRAGVRSLAPRRALAAKLQKGLTAAAQEKRVFHLWFHPSNFWHDTGGQFATLEWFLSRLAGEVARGRLAARTMASYA